MRGGEALSLAGADSVRCWRLVRQPGNGTRYDIFITEDPRGGLRVSWPDARWHAWASRHPGGEVRPERRGHAADLREIAKVVDELRHALAEADREARGRGSRGAARGCGGAR